MIMIVMFGNDDIKICNHEETIIDQNDDETMTDHNHKYTDRSKS